MGDVWIRKSGRSPDWWDSWVILLWVCGLFPRVLRYHVFVLADRAVHGKGIGACVEQVCYFAAS